VTPSAKVLRDATRLVRNANLIFGQTMSRRMLAKVARKLVDALPFHNGRPNPRYRRPR
jgi:hypothetical protein